MSSRPRVLLRGYYGRKNFGDDLLMVVSHRFIREKLPHAIIHVQSSAKACEYVRDMCDGAVIVRGTEPIRYDLVLDGGGGVFFDYEEGPSSRELLNAGLKWAGARGVRRVLDYYRRAAGQVSARRQIGIGIGVGTFTKGSRKLFKALEKLGGYDDLLVRDPGSVENATELLSSERVRLGSDLAFARRYWVPRRIERPSQGKPKVAFVLRDWPYEGDTGIHGSARAMEMLAERGIATEVFAFDPETDVDVMKRFPAATVWRPEEMSLESFCHELAAASVVVSARAHGAIAPACLGVPSICIAIEPKLAIVSKDMLPLSSSLVPGDVTATELVREITSVLDSAEERAAAAREDSSAREATLLRLLDTVELLPELRATSSVAGG